MQNFQIDDLEIHVHKQGSREYAKVSYPIRYGVCSEIKTPAYTFQFNLNGEIKFIQGRDKNWPDPSEWLKRSVGDDWAYYSTGGYSGIFDAFGEYYLPCPDYPSNAVIVHDPFDDAAVTHALRSWHLFHADLRTLALSGLPRKIRTFLETVRRNGPETLDQKARLFHQLIGGPVTVLPPDTRHVDYEVIPVTVADGCLYKCGFCRVKTRKNFTPRTGKNIVEQITQLKGFYDKNFSNYKALFLGQHDALHAGPELIRCAAETAYDTFEMEKSHMTGPARLFLFGSVDSLLNAAPALFDMLSSLPFYTYINIGLESADPTTLEMIRKPITADAVAESFVKIGDVNRAYEHIEISANFLFGDGLPSSHMKAFAQLAENNKKNPQIKGTVYFSPLVNTGVETNRGMIRKFYKIKAMSPFPTFIYLIQRL